MVVEFAEPLTVGPLHVGSLGAPPTRAQWAAAMWAGVVSTLMIGVQPLLWAALVEAGRLTGPEIGLTAMAELLVTGVVTGLTGAFLPATRMRTIAVAAALTLAGLDVLTGRLAHGQVMIVRALAGAPSGLLLWVVISLIARSSDPVRWSGLLLGSQTLLQMLVAATASALAVPRWGAEGGYVLGGAVTCTVAIAAAWLPSRLEPLGAEMQGGGPPPLGWLALVGIVALTAAGTAVFVYLGPLGREAGLSVGLIGAAVSIQLGGQTLGAAATAAWGSRVPLMRTMGLCVALLLAFYAVLGGRSATPVFFGAAFLVGFLGLVVGPLEIPLTLRIDPTRRTALQIGGAQLLGAALGPLIASRLVKPGDAHPVLVLAAILLVVGFALVCAARFLPGVVRRAA